MMLRTGTRTAGRFGFSGLASTNPGVETLIRQRAAALGVDPNLAVTVARHESGLNQSAVSSAGAIGVFQLMPATARDLGVDPYDPEQNINGGVAYLAQMLTRYHGDTAAALAAYNEGPGAYDSGRMYPETRQYVSSILADWEPTGPNPQDLAPGGSSSPYQGPQPPLSYYVAQAQADAQAPEAQAPEAQDAPEPAPGSPPPPRASGPSGAVWAVLGAGALALWAYS